MLHQSKCCRSRPGKESEVIPVLDHSWEEYFSVFGVAGYDARTKPSDDCVSKVVENKLKMNWCGTSLSF